MEVIRSNDTRAMKTFFMAFKLSLSWSHIYFRFSKEGVEVEGMNLIHLLTPIANLILPLPNR